MTAEVLNQREETHHEFSQINLDAGDERCGEIYIKLSGTLVFHCMLCSSYLDNFGHFLDHLTIQHYDVVQEDSVKKEIQDEYSENEAQIHPDGNSNKLCTQEEEEETYDSDYNDDYIFNVNITDDDCDNYDDGTYDDDNVSEEIEEKINIKTHSNFEMIEKVFLEDTTTLSSFKHEKLVEELELEFYSDEQENNDNKIKNKHLPSPPPRKKFKRVRRSLQPDKDGNFNCEECGKEFGSKRKLARHYNTHSELRRFRCEICGFAFKERPNLDAHIRRHSGVGPIDCGYCSKTFFTRAEAQSHRRTHTGERPFVCSICSVGFTNAARLKIHSKRHFSDPEYKCSYCSKGFYGKADLKDHILVHTKEKTFHCNFCGGWFARRKSLMRHINKLHATNNTEKE